MLRPVFLRLAAAAALALTAAAAPAQVATVDPNTAVDPAPQGEPAEPGFEAEEAEYQPVDAGTQDSAEAAAVPEADWHLSPCAKGCAVAYNMYEDESPHAPQFP